MHELLSSCNDLKTCFIKEVGCLVKNVECLFRGYVIKVDTGEQFDQGRSWRREKGDLTGNLFLVFFLSGGNFWLSLDIELPLFNIFENFISTRNDVIRDAGERSNLNTITAIGCSFHQLVQKNNGIIPFFHCD